jgi:hypothetical protein
VSRNVAAEVLRRRFGSTSRKAVALVLADHADGDAWSTIVGQQRIGAEAELSTRQVRRILSEFESEGLISRQRRHRKDGTRTSDRIVLNQPAIGRLPDSMSAGLPDTDDTDYRTNDAGTTGQIMSAQEPSVEPPVEPSVIATASLNDIKGVLVEVFGEPPPQGWSLYNRIATWIRDRGGTPADVRLRASRLVEEWGRKAATPAALEKHWTRYDAEVGSITDADVEKYQTELRQFSRRQRAIELDAKGLPG